MGEAEDEILAHGAGEEGWFLGDERAGGAVLGEGQGGKGVVVDEEGAGGGGVEAREEGDDGCFAAAGGADEGGVGGCGEGEGEVLVDGRGARGVGEGDVAEFDRHAARVGWREFWGGGGGGGGGVAHFGLAAVGEDAVGCGGCLCDVGAEAEERAGCLAALHDGDIDDEELHDVVLVAAEQLATVPECKRHAAELYGVAERKDEDRESRLFERLPDVVF